MPDERLYTVTEACAYIEAYPVTPRRIDEVGVHHTWSPTAADYRGQSTIAGVRHYHMDTKGWRDNGYHWMIAPNGDVWRCRPMLETGAHIAGRNEHTVGISFIANFDVQDPATFGGLRAGYQVIAALCRRYELDLPNIRFHREFADKTCPGTKTTFAMVRGGVGALLAGETQDPEPDPHLPDVDDWAESAVAWCKAEGLMVGYPDGSFAGRAAVTREELAVVLKRFADKEA